MALDQRAFGRRQTGVLPRAPDREPLPDGVRSGDALALTVARAADAADQGVDSIPVALGVSEPLDDEQRRALAHHEPVGAIRIGARAGRRQRPDRAELGEHMRAHVAVDAASDRNVELVGEQPI